MPTDIRHAGDWRGSGLVLVVEDEAPVRRLATAMLTHLGFTVVVAADATQAVGMFRERRSELVLVLLDLTIPGDAEQLAAEIARGDRHVPIVLSSGHDAQELDRRFAGRKVAGFLQKPYRLDELRIALRDALSAS